MNFRMLKKRKTFISKKIGIGTAILPSKNIIFVFIYTYYTRHSTNEG